LSLKVQQQRIISYASLATFPNSALKAQ